MKYRETIPFPPIFPPKSKPRIGATRELLLFTFASCGANQSEAWILGSFWGQWNCCHLLHTKPPITSNFFSLVLFSKASSRQPHQPTCQCTDRADGHGRGRRAFTSLCRHHRPRPTYVPRQVQELTVYPGILTGGTL